MNIWNEKNCINQCSFIYECVVFIEVGYVVFFVKDVKVCEKFYCEYFGFVFFDCYLECGVFLCCVDVGGYYDIFLL